MSSNDAEPVPSLKDLKQNKQVLTNILEYSSIKVKDKAGFFTLLVTYWFCMKHFTNKTFSLKCRINKIRRQKSTLGKKISKQRTKLCIAKSFRNNMKINLIKELVGICLQIVDKKTSD